MLQNVPKLASNTQTYDGARGKKAKVLEKTFTDLIFSTMTEFADPI